MHQQLHTLLSNDYTIPAVTPTRPFNFQVVHSEETAQHNIFHKDLF